MIRVCDKVANPTTDLSASFLSARPLLGEISAVLHLPVWPPQHGKSSIHKPVEDSLRRTLCGISYGDFSAIVAPGWPRDVPLSFCRPDPRKKPDATLRHAGT